MEHKPQQPFIPLHLLDQAQRHMPENAERKNSRDYDVENGLRWVREGKRRVYRTDETLFEQ